MYAHSYAFCRRGVALPFFGVRVTLELELIPQSLALLCFSERVPTWCARPKRARKPRALGASAL